MLVQEEARNRTGRPGLILHGMAPSGRILTTDNWKNKLLTGLALYVKTERRISMPLHSLLHSILNCLLFFFCVCGVGGVGVVMVRGVGEWGGGRGVFESFS